MVIMIQELLYVNYVHINAFLAIYHRIIVQLVAWYLAERRRPQVVLVNRVFMILLP